MGKTFLIFGFPFMILSIIGNLLTIITVFKSRTLRSRNAIRLTTSLAFCDLLFSVLNCPVNLVTDLLDSKAINPTLCRINGFLGILFCMSNVLTLSVLSFDRYVAIVKPFRYTIWMTGTRVNTIIVSIWIFSAIIASVPLFGWGNYIFCPQKRFCFVDYNKDIGILIFLSMWFCVAVMVILFSYYHIFKEAKRHRKQIESLKVGPILNKEDIGVIGLKQSNGLSNFKFENKAAFTVFIIISTFFVCWLPFSIVNLTSGIMKYSIPRSADVISTILILISSCVNPIFYGWFDSSFRSAFKRILSSALTQQSLGTSIRPAV